jgi:PhnB protein
MKSKVKQIPEGYEAPTAYLIVKDGAAAIDFYKKAFGAKEVMRMPGPDGKIGHADLRIGGGHIMLADEDATMGVKAPKGNDMLPVSLLIYCDNVDDVVKRAASAGATVIRPVADQFYGDRTGGLRDPFGHLWYVATHIEDVSNEEMVKRAAAARPEAVKA